MRHHVLHSEHLVVGEESAYAQRVQHLERISARAVCEGNQPKRACSEILNERGVGREEGLEVERVRPPLCEHRRLERSGQPAVLLGHLQGLDGGVVLLEVLVAQRHGSLLRLEPKLLNHQAAHRRPVAVGGEAGAHVVESVIDVEDEGGDRLRVVQ